MRQAGVVRVPTDPIEQREITGLFQTPALFQGVPLTSIRDILRRCDERQCAAGDILLRPDVPNEAMYLILTGRVSVHLDTVDNPPLRILGAGECVGEMSLFDGELPSAFVQVVEPSVLLVIRQATLWEMIDTSHGVARNLLRLLSHRLRANNLTMTEIEKQKRQHEQDASRDALTGLHNRRWLENLLARLQGDTLSAYLPLSVIMLDIDHFKQMNDCYGHQVGDVALQALANLLRQNVRPNDMIARYGGEEFILLLPRTAQTGAWGLAERLRQHVAEHRVQCQGQSFPRITISAGIAGCTTAMPLAQVIRKADAALYRAKRLGRNCVCDAV